MKQLSEQFRIGKLACRLGVERFVIRFWEKEFGISAHRSPGGQRFYKTQDFETFKLIKELLYEKGFTIAGAKKILQGDTHQVLPNFSDIKKNNSTQNLTEQIKKIQKQLMKLHELL